MSVSGILLLTLDLLVKVTPLGTLSVFSRDPEVSGQRRTRRHHRPAKMAASSVPKVQGIPNVPQVNLPDCVYVWAQPPVKEESRVKLGLTSRRDSSGGSRASGRAAGKEREL